MNEDGSHLCPECGGPLPPPHPGGRRRIFCSNRCRKNFRYGGRCADCGGRTNGGDGAAKRAVRCAGCSRKAQRTLPDRLRRSAAAAGKGVWSREDAAAALRTAAAVQGEPLSHKRYSEVSAGLGPSAPTVIKLFGSWREACRAAGVAHGRPPRAGYERFSVAECRWWAARCAKELGRLPSLAEYDRWAQRTAGAPSLARFRQVAGSLAVMLAEMFPEQAAGAE